MHGSQLILLKKDPLRKKLENIYTFSGLAKNPDSTGEAGADPPLAPVKKGRLRLRHTVFKFSLVVILFPPVIQGEG